MSPFWLTRMKRRPVVVLGTVCLSMVFCVLLCFLDGFLERQQREKERVQDSFEIECVVSDVAGSRTTKLEIRGVRLDCVTHEAYPLTEYVRNVRLGRDWYYAWHGSNESEEGYAALTALNSAWKIPELSESFGGLVRFFDWFAAENGYDTQDAGVEAFLTKNEAVCLISSKMLQDIREGRISGAVQMEMSEKDSENAEGQPEAQYPEDSLYLRIRIIDIAWDWEREILLRVAGEYAADGTQIFIPWNYAAGIMLEQDETLTCDRLRFSVKDNSQLQEMKRLASQYYSEVDPTNGNAWGYALTVHDGQYQETLQALEQNIARAKLLLPILFVLVVGIAFLISFLTTRNEGRSYALMRSIGVTGSGVYFGALWEQMVLSVLGGTVGCVGYFVVAGFDGLRSVRAAFLYFGCYLVGCSVAAIRAALNSPMRLLREE